MYNLQMTEADFDGCQLGMQSDEGVPVKKPWRVATNDVELHKALAGRRCPGAHCHQKWGGQDVGGHSQVSSADAPAHPQCMGQEYRKGGQGAG